MMQTYILRACCTRPADIGSVSGIFAYIDSDPKTRFLNLNDLLLGHAGEFHLPASV